MKHVFGNNDPNAEVVILYGNCQTLYLAHLLASADSPQSGRSYVVGLNFAMPGEEIDRVEPDFLRRCTLYFEQYDEAQVLPARAVIRDGIPRGTPTIKFPPLVMHSFWPFEVYEPRARRTEHYPLARFPFGDRIGLEVIQQKLTGEAAYDAYMRLSHEQMPDIWQRLDFDFNKMASRDLACDIKMSDYFSMCWRGLHLFWTGLHPAREPMALLGSRLYEAAHPLLGGDLAMGMRVIEETSDTLGGMKPYQVPVHPLIVETLDLGFGGPDMKYEWFDEKWTFKEYMTRYLAYDENWGHIGY